MKAARGDVSRAAWLDRLRGVASVGMIVVHVTHAVLRAELHETPAFRVADFAFGLVAPAFLFCVGASFAIAERREGAGDFGRRLARALGLFALGYAMHASGLVGFLRTHDGAELRVFLQADILQIIALALAVLAIFSRIARARADGWEPAALVLGVFAFTLAPFTQALRAGAFPAALLTYLSFDVPSQFPLLPWIGHALLAAGACAFALSRRSERWPFALALAALGGALVSYVIPLPPHDPWRAGPSYAFARLAIVAFGGGILGLVRPPAIVDRILSLFGRRSLFLYVVHVALVYGRHPWSLRARVGATLGVTGTAIACALVVIAMGALAWAWERALRASSARRASRDRGSA